MNRPLIAVCLAITFTSIAATESLLDTGARALQKGDFATAEQALREVVRREPKNPRAHKLLGMTFSARERYAESEPEFREACRLDAREENACYYLGRALYTMSRFAEARQAFETALRNSAAGGRPLHGLGLVAEALGRTADAERFYRRAIAGGEERARLDLGRLLFETGRGPESVKVLRESRLPEAGPLLERVMREAPAQRAAAVSPIRFEQQELPMIVRNGATGEKRLPETAMGGVAVLDYDGDGWPDIYVADRYSNRLFRNNRDGTFTDVTQKAGVAGHGDSMGVAAADFDNDGHTDLFVTGVHRNTLYRNRGDGVFEDVTERAGVAGDGEWAVAAGWFDYDNDGLLDLFVVNYVVWDPADEPVCGGDKLRTYCHPSYYQPLANKLYHNEGKGRFRDVSVESGIAAHKGKGMGLAFGDYDGDGRLDVLVANDTMPNFLFHNEGGGRFRETAIAAGVAWNADGKAISSMGVDFRDYDNDGREDIVITALSNETFPLFRNLGGRFSDATAASGMAAQTRPYTGWSVAMADFNNDGFKDIFAACGHVMDNAELLSSRKSRQPNLVLTNLGNGGFARDTLPGEAFHRAAAFADFDRDGRIDAVVVRLNESPLLLRNRSAQRHWIDFALTGTRSNRDAIGALVRIHTAAGDQWNRVTQAVGYGSSSALTVHFGLGDARIVEKVDIRWPSGVVQSLDNVDADRFVTVTEPD